MGISERKERERERRRIEIIEAAERLFFKNGIENTTVEAVAAEAELSKATVYLYFKSKEELYHAIFIRGHELMYSLIDRELEKARSTEEKLQAFFLAIVEFQRQHPQYFDAFFYFLTNEVWLKEEHLTCPEHQEMDQKYLNMWIELVQKGKEEGTIRHDLNAMPSVLILWMQLLGFLKMLSVQQPLLTKMFGATEKEILDEYFKLMLNGLT